MSNLPRNKPYVKKFVDRQIKTNDGQVVTVPVLTNPLPYVHSFGAKSPLANRRAFREFMKEKGKPRGQQLVYYVRKKTKKNGQVTKQTIIRTKLSAKTHF